jgi:hypothetical protein
MTNRPIEPPPTAETLEPTALKRRGLFAAAWAAVAGLMLKETTQPVEATVGSVEMVTGDTNSYVQNFPTTPVFIENQLQFGTAISGSNVLRVVANNPSVDAFVGDASSGGRYGVTGIANTANAAGTVGYFTGSKNGFAMFAVNGSSYTGGTSGGGGWGVYAASQNGHALVGASSTAGAAGFVGSNNGIAGAYAGLFYGPMIVNGDFTVTGVKSAAVPHPDGTLRRLYCVESPESWFEDFGKGQLACGLADVPIDPEFAAVADLADYHVFLAGYDDFDLRVSDVTSAGFRVVAKDPAAAGRFSWRVVAKRRDVAGPRLEAVQVPAAPTMPTLDLPQLPARPPVPSAGRTTVHRG